MVQQGLADPLFVNGMTLRITPGQDNPSREARPGDTEEESNWPDRNGPPERGLFLDDRPTPGDRATGTDIAERSAVRHR